LSDLRWDHYEVDNGTYLATLYINAFLSNSKSCSYYTYDECAIIICEPSDKVPAGLIHPRFDELSTSSNDAAQKPSLALETLESHVVDFFLDFSKGSVSHLNPFAGRLPAMKELTLCGYDWIHSRAEYVLLWDFSRLQSLELSYKFQYFVEGYDGVPPSHVQQLEKLTMFGTQRRYR